MSDLDIRFTKEARDGLEAYFRDLVMEIYTESQENIVENETSDRGKLLQDSRVDFIIDPINLKFEAIVYYWAPYADCVEFGTNPHWVPPSELEGWVRRKLGIDRKHALGVAFAVAHKIAKYGTPPQPFWRPAMETVLNRWGIEL